MLYPNFRYNMSSVKIVVRKKPNKDGTLPLCLRITKDRKSTFVHLGYSVKESDWDANLQRVRKSHPNSARLNNFLISKLSENTDKTLELETRKKDVTVRAIRQKIKPKVGESFFKQADDYLETLTKRKKYNIRSADEPRIKQFKKFMQNRDVAFADLSVGLMEKFKTNLIEMTNLGERTIMNHFVVIRSVCAHARKNGVITQEMSPFGKGKFQIKFPESAKIGLEPAEIKEIEDIDLSSEPLRDHARNIWLTSYYFGGMRVSDVLRLLKADFQNGRLYYTMGKNDKTDSLPILEKAFAIVDKYMGQDYRHGLLFPDLQEVEDINDAYEVEKRIKTRVGALSGHLKIIAERAGIKKSLSMHIARHSFGNNAGDKIPLPILQKIFRHKHISTTMNYMANFRHADVDNAFKLVLG